jgi:hypothetical protein
MKKKKEITYNQRVETGEAIFSPVADYAPKADPPYAFPSKSRCPRCRSTHTTRTGAAGEKQYRTCMIGRCGWKYTVTGTLI